MNKETPHARFVRLASKRTNAVLEKLRVLGNCANRSLYEYTDEEAKKVFSVIEAELKAARNKFQSSRKKTFEL